MFTWLGYETLLLLICRILHRFYPITSHQSLTILPLRCWRKVLLSKVASNASECYKVPVLQLAFVKFTPAICYDWLWSFTHMSLPVSPHISRLSTGTCRNKADRIFCDNDSLVWSHRPVCNYLDNNGIFRHFPFISCHNGFLMILSKYE